MGRRQDDIISGLNFLCERPCAAWPPSPSTCVHLSLTPSPLRVDVINGWLLTWCGRPMSPRNTWDSDKTTFCLCIQMWSNKLSQSAYAERAFTLSPKSHSIPFQHTLSRQATTTLKHAFTCTMQCWLWQCDLWRLINSSSINQPQPIRIDWLSWKALGPIARLGHEQKQV